MFILLLPSSLKDLKKNAPISNTNLSERTDLKKESGDD